MICLFDEFFEYYFGDLVPDCFFFEFGVEEVFFEGFYDFVFVYDYGFWFVLSFHAWVISLCPSSMKMLTIVV